MTELQEMTAALAGARPEVLPSKYWEWLNRMNFDQLHTKGYDNFKQTLALNYFTWMLSSQDGQIRYLGEHLPAAIVLCCGLRAFFSRRHPHFTKQQSWAYNHVTHLLWEYARRNDREHILDRLCEPTQGNPPRVYRRGKLISQDLANSALEYLAVMESGVHRDGIQSVMELGAGYGRTAFVFLTLLPRVKYVIVDIPPALYVAQKYLSAQFPNRKVFRFRSFQDFTMVREEFTSADLAFLLPNQLDLLPDKVVDLFINISSLHEMRPEQIAYYFAAVDRLTRKYFYFKQWKTTVVPFENITITETNYPVPGHWQTIYWRECKVQTYFFEALLCLSAEWNGAAASTARNSRRFDFPHRPL